MNPGSAGIVLVVAGLALVAAGVLAMGGAFDWFGRLPGDLRFEWGSVHVYVPITSMVLVSAVLSLAVFVLRRLLGLA